MVFGVWMEYTLRQGKVAFVRGIHRSPVDSPQNWPVTRNMFPFDDVIMYVHLKIAHLLMPFELHLINT